MIKIEVNSVQHRPNKKDPSKPGFRIVHAFAHLVDHDGKPQKYPQAFDYFLRDEQQEPAPGVYTLAPQSIYCAVDERGNRTLRIGSVVLAPAK